MRSSSLSGDSSFCCIRVDTSSEGTTPGGRGLAMIPLLKRGCGSFKTLCSVGAASALHVPFANSDPDSDSRSPHPKSQISPSCSEMSAVPARSNSATLFDYVSRPGVTNFKMGAPGEVALQKCTEILKKATVHRMVRSLACQPPSRETKWCGGHNTQLA